MFLLTWPVSAFVLYQKKKKFGIKKLGQVKRYFTFEADLNGRSDDAGIFIEWC